MSVPDNMSSEEKTKAISLAVDNDDPRLLEMYLNSMAQNNEHPVFSGGAKPWVFSAVNNGHVECLSLLLKNEHVPCLEISPREQNDDNFFWACHKGNVDIVSLLLDNIDKDAEEVIRSQDSIALRIAAEEGNFELFKFFEDKGFLDILKTGPLKINAQKTCEKISPDFLEHLIICPSSKQSFFNGDVMSGDLMSGIFLYRRSDLLEFLLTRSSQKEHAKKTALSFMSLSQTNKMLDDIFWIASKNVLPHDKNQDIFLEFVQKKIEIMLLRPIPFIGVENKEKDAKIISDLLRHLPEEIKISILTSCATKKVLDNYVPCLTKKTQEIILDNILAKQIGNLNQHPLLVAHAIKKTLPHKTPKKIRKRI